MFDANLVVVGAGGHSKSIQSVLSERPSRIVACGEDDAFLREYQGERVIIAVGYVGNGSPTTSVRRRILDLYDSHHVNFATVIAPTATVLSEAIIDVDTVVLSRAVINANAVIGRHCIINTGALIEHDVTLLENVHIAPGAIILGGARIGSNAFVGAGSIVRQGVSVASGVVIGMGSVVCADIPEPGTYVGNPLRRMS